jgi:transposase
VAARSRVSVHSLYSWTKRYSVPEEERKAVNSQADEMKHLKAELKRVMEERDILKKAEVYFAKTSGLGTPYKSAD